MFLLLSRVLLWLLIGTVVYSLFQRFYPKGSFIGRLVLVIVLFVLALSFINPNEPAVASLWKVVSFPLKPLGASVLLMMFAAQKIKAGVIDKPGGYLVGWSLTILLLASTPAIAYFLVRVPIAMLGNPNLATQEIIQDHRLVSSLRPENSYPETLVAFGPPTTPTMISDVVGNNILLNEQQGRATIAFNSLGVTVPPYLSQTPPQEIANRGLRIEDFVPSAETLQLTTQVWESYLNQIYFFLRGNQTPN
ncbi:hypothetical protein [Nodularia sphaerocarpa]|uniref:hypothetical protein n=1 Tax=Nodularia sphaerocarpa TaxID=137816 RepID=UPI001EFC0F22|nr:hypothetical protein [Nodularia sphaerocarpa]MDB9371882.1 hypothetical protein [Nodularia sphaerocarpa CS-585]MDB9377798.1 hypothetical protein [Nodularia sphaerocarpa CS-585A2]ULP74452.1 hypothetical protein BDGGKGIB_04120 [Nodularia sphaerocarpa UHCC 0038]